MVERHRAGTGNHEYSIEFDACVLAQINAELNGMLKQPDTRERLASYGLIPAPGTAEDLGEYLRAEIARWTKVVKAAGISLN
jgi:tripartite-type tricarboxylate transporter receptor subunit TctC